MNPTITPGTPAPCPHKMKRGQSNANPAYKDFVARLATMPPAGDENLLLRGFSWCALYTSARLAGMDIVTRKVHTGIRVWRVR